jgi:hypothetical protein
MIHRWEAVWAASDLWQRLALIGLIVATVGQVLFVVKYATRRWYDYRVGRAMMGKAASLACVLVLSVVNTFVVYRFQEPIAAIAIVAIAVFIWYQTYVLFTSPRYINLDEEART